MVSPAQGSLDAVHAWLRGAGVSEAAVSPGGDYIRATVTVGEAERLFPGAEYAAFVDEAERRVVHRVRDPETFALPAELREHVDFVEPTVTFPPKSVRVHSSKDKGLPGGFKTNPSTLRDMYNMGDHEASCNASCHNSQQVASFLNNSFSPKDLQMFFQQYYPKAEGRTPTPVSYTHLTLPTKA